MIIEAIQDQEATSICMESVKHSSLVTSEALALLSRLNKPENGFKELSLSFQKLDQKVSETVLEQFLQHVKHLELLEMGSISPQGLPEVDQEADRPNIQELASRILEVQEDNNLRKLNLSHLGGNKRGVLSDEAMLLINTIVQTGCT